MFKIAFQQVFDNFNVNLHKKEGFLTSIRCVPIPEYGQSKAPLVRLNFKKYFSYYKFLIV